MKNLITILIAFLGLCYANCICAQTAATTYYRIMSAKHTFSNYCIQDNTNNNNGSNDFLISEVDSSDVHQHWMIIPNADTSAYYIRNRYSKRYIGQSYIITNNFYYAQNAAVESTAAAWRILPIKDDQVAFCTTDEYGVSRFLNAADITADTPDKISYTSTAVSSGFAWIVVNILTGTTGISKTLADKTPPVFVLGHQIIVNGTNKYRILDMSGRTLPNGSTLPRGIYIVIVNGQSYKIFVK